MYTNIDVTASEHLLENKIKENYHLIEASTAGIDCDVLMTLVKLCNKYSMYFQFRNSFYQQIKGLAMGTPLSGLLANIYVEHIENWALDSYFLKHIFWGRYMDDVISLWNYGENELKGFLDHLNT
jgi:retron-type reverse transcriptase